MVRIILLQVVEQCLIVTENITLQETFTDLVNCNSESVVNVCNLKPAMELMTSWQNTVSEDTPENTKLVQ